ncbi:Apoptosis 1 inhibitor [Oopsacas minuta]|uniref:Apoptosis 1 inhibitor n=1 Tax=Oopsacas minuta TaxID=111878 RepID=A0AAV7K9K3_9METZ|nr:Apoptosis 1 inhibitor [Oopsacas minuta]
MTSESKYKDYETTEQRRRSFQNYPKSYPTIQRLVEAGFFYVGVTTEDDDCQCYSCGVKLFNWAEKDDPMKEHRKFRPNCKVVKLTNNPESMASGATWGSPSAKYSPNNSDIPHSDPAHPVPLPHPLFYSPILLSTQSKQQLYADLNVINHVPSKTSSKESMYSAYQQEKPPDEEPNTIVQSPSQYMQSHLYEANRPNVYNTSQGDVPPLSPRAGIHQKTPSAVRLPIQSDCYPDSSQPTYYKPPHGPQLGLCRTSPARIDSLRTGPLQSNGSDNLMYSTVTNGGGYRPQYSFINENYALRTPITPTYSQQFLARPSNGSSYYPNY